MKIIKASELERDCNKYWGCNNCVRQHNTCFGARRDCRLSVVMADQLSEPDKVGNLVRVLNALNMKVVVIGDGFRIVAV